MDNAALLWLREMKWDLRCWCGERNGLFQICFYLFYNSSFRALYQPDPDIVIEGFGGSANSFAVYAFATIQEEVKIAHHLHITSQIKWAVRKERPVIVIVRRPDEAVASLLSRGFYPSAHLGLRHYRDFYRDVLPYRNGFVLAEFEQFTADMPSIVRAVNEKFGSSFLFSDDMAEKGLERLKKEGRGTRSGLPSREREDRKKQASELVEQARNSLVWNQAFEVYQKITENTACT